MKAYFICDQAVDLHFPSHFSDVYIQGLKKRGINTEVIAYKKGKTNEKTRSYTKNDNVTLIKKQSDSLLMKIMQKLMLAVAIPIYLSWQSFADERQVCVVHNDVLVGLGVAMITTIIDMKFMYRITKLKETVLCKKGTRLYKAAARFMQYVRAKVIKRASVTILMSEEMKHKLTKEQISESENYKVISSKVDVTKTVDQINCAQKYKRVEKEMRKKECRHWMVYAGSLNPNRELSIMVDILVQCRRKRHIDLGLVVFGVYDKRDYLERLKQYGRKRNVSEYISWQDPVPEKCLPYVLSLADVGICPLPVDETTKYSSPIKVMEYMRAGIPTISSNIPDSTTVLERSNGGEVAKCSAGSFAKSISTILKSNNKYKQGQRLRSWLRGERSLECALDEWENIFAQCS